MTNGLIKAKDRDTVIQSLQAGVVPRRGQHLIQVGRVEETKAVIRDLDRIAEGGSAIRFVIGEYGSGKTFFLSLVRAIALEKKLVTAHADLTPDRRLHATSGQARSLYAELMQNLSTRTKPDGGALPSVVERFVTSAISEGRDRDIDPEEVIRERLAHLSEMVGGYDFAEVIAAYWRGHDSGDEALKASAIRWLRGEYTTRTDARSALGVRTIVDDANVYDQLKLFTQLVRLAGYSGFLICLDELVNLYKLANTQARRSNYEQILRILNDCLQGTSVGLGFMLGGTPDFLMDTRRGLYSYPALQSRLAENTFAVNGLVDYNNPVLRLGNLSPEDLFVLLSKIRHVFASGDPGQYLLPDAGIQAFMAHCSQRIGDAYFRTPRNTVKAFIDLLSVLDQNKQITWTDLVAQVNITTEANPDLLTAQIQGNGKVVISAEDDDLASFRL
ncbi:ATP-binding protein [Oculatella sp. FACHB-28]|uniref:ATP-binding protein n=1 Tax=Cyanophyceae TaxID=3028117 RepID=UPI001688E0DF|nr:MULTISPECIES: ATP-binding protein [Cyanophyceae]MBD2056906.1 ATP-binding protein [Oculatella sp. FACHB-28]MBD2068263.1 ATP-binding protein [Leptolyngbya sp. FACHB-671]